MNAHLTVAPSKTAFGVKLLLTKKLSEKKENSFAETDGDKKSSPPSLSPWLSSPVKSPNKGPPLSPKGSPELGLKFIGHKAGPSSSAHPQWMALLLYLTATQLSLSYI